MGKIKLIKMLGEIFREYDGEWNIEFYLLNTKTDAIVYDEIHEDLEISYIPQTLNDIFENLRDEDSSEDIEITIILHGDDDIYEFAETDY